MVRRILSIFFVIILGVAFSTVTFAQEKKEATQEKKETTQEKKEMKKDDKMGMTKEEKAMGPLKSLSCDETCGFMVRSHDEKEVISVMKTHAKKTHKKDMTEKEMKDMMKTEAAPEMHK